MKSHLIALPCLALLVTAAAQAQPAAGVSKVGIIHFQNAMLGTKEGQKAAAELQSRFDPKSKELEKKRNDIAALRESFQKTANTASEEVKARTAREIDTKTKSLQRDTEDAQAEFDQDRQRLLNEIGQKLLAVLNKYARDNAYTLILDVSSEQSGVMFAADTIDVTQDVVVLYDKNVPAAAPPPTGAKPGMTPSAPPPATSAPKPAGGGRPAGGTAPPVAPPKK